MVARRKDSTRTSDDHEGVDYGATADTFAKSPSSPSSDEEEEASSDADNDMVQQNDTSESEEGDVMEDEEPSTAVVHSASGERCTFDLHNLLAMNAHQIDTSLLYSTPSKKTTDQKLAIPGEQLGVEINEEYLREKASDGCAQLVAALWQLPVERSDAGPMVSLPLFDASKIPRALVSGLDATHPVSFLNFEVKIPCDAGCWLTFAHRISNTQCLPPSC